jgi:hypothetical protein
MKMNKPSKPPFQTTAFSKRVFWWFPEVVIVIAKSANVWSTGMSKSSVVELPCSLSSSFFITCGNPARFLKVVSRWGLILLALTVLKVSVESSVLVLSPSRPPQPWAEKNPGCSAYSSLEKRRPIRRHSKLNFLLNLTRKMMHPSFYKKPNPSWLPVRFRCK